MDTSVAYIERLRELVDFIVNLEDLGLGGRDADLTINEFFNFDEKNYKNTLTGISNSIVSPFFEITEPAAEIKDNIEKILVIFGGQILQA